MNQGIATEQAPDALLTHLKQGIPPVPGQVTSILLALKVVFEALRHETELERKFACALYLLASESRRSFDRGRNAGVAWPPLLDEDLSRIAAAVKSIFVDRWQ
jgi:hypothetical protein